jgi:hypothetical protein
MSARESFRRLPACVVVVLVLLPQLALAASRYDPVLRFRTLRTAHFTICYHRGEEPVVSRLAQIAEDVHRELTGRLRAAPRGRTFVVLVDQDDVSNGFATPLPYNTIEIAAAWPALSSLIGNSDDWLRLVFTHEYTHILDLDRSESWAAGIRAIFGRAPLAFPNLFLPTWQTEGSATLAESRLTGRGRLSDGEFAALVDLPLQAGARAPIDRVNGGLIDWPGGDAPYAWGGFFYEYLADRFGEQKLSELSQRTAATFYYCGSTAFKRVFGRGLNDLWSDFVRDRRAALPAEVSDSAKITRLTRQGFVVERPRFLDRAGDASPAAAQGGPGEVAYSVRNADDFPALMAVGLDGTSPPRQIATRFGGSTVAAVGSLVYFDQVELVRNTAERSDLYLLDRRSGRVHRLTRDARLLEPDVSRDGHSLACIRLERGARTLVVYALEPGGDGGPRLAPEPKLVVSATGAHYGSPRWSPDGRLIAAERQLLNGPSQVVVVDPASGEVRPIAASEHHRNATPAWMPEGDTILFSSDNDGGVFSLFAAGWTGRPGVLPEPGGELRVYHVASPPTGAISPDVSPDGRTIVFAGSTPAGGDLFTIAVDRATWRLVSPAATVGMDDTPQTGQSASSVDNADPPALGRESAYSPLPTLLPRYWLPAAKVDDGHVHLGASTGGADVLGYHSYGLSALWPVAGGGAEHAAYGKRLDWQVSYAYDRWLPTFYGTASDETRFLPRAQPAGPGAEGGLIDEELREQHLALGVWVPMTRVRLRQAFQGELNFSRDTLRTPERSDAFRRDAFRLAWWLTSAKRYGYSVSAEQGVTAAITSELVRSALGADGNATAFTAEARGYPRLGGLHRILAVRAGLGYASGDPAVRRTFYLGGSQASTLADFGVDALSMLRGFPDKIFAGSRSAVFNVDYRSPLLRIERGRGTVPIFLRTLHGAVFIDGGRVWDRESSAGGLKTSAGGELSLDVVLGYALPLTCTAGIAWRHDPSGFAGRGPVAYVRVGPAF